MNTNQKKLEALRKKKADIDAKMKSIKAKQLKKDRKDETRRKILVGSLILENVKNGKYPEDKLLSALDDFLTRDIDRNLFGLSPKQKNSESNNNEENS